MSNQYFRFKQFVVDQEHCAMKVTTDGCLFGAWVAEMESMTWHNEIVENGILHKVLDIGAGTGLLSLMVAQKNISAIIDAVELDTKAAHQAKENAEKSPWQNRIHIVQEDIKLFKVDYLYDTIISNPPFYEQQLKGSDVGKNAAHHSSHLSLEALFQNVNRMLAQDGILYILLPFYRTEEAIELAEKCHLFPAKKILVKQSPKHSYFRSMLAFSHSVTKPEQQELIVEMERGKYSENFIELLKDYYLKL